jgi:hypothetical protein
VDLLFQMQTKLNCLKITLLKYSSHIPTYKHQHTILVKNYLDNSLPVSLSIKHFTPNDVKFAIQNYSLKKSPGYDLITAEVARCLPKRAIVLLTVLFNVSLRLTYFPQLWKFSTIIIFSKPKMTPDIPSSYRPISLLPFFCKNLRKTCPKKNFTMHYFQ